MLRFLSTFLFIVFGAGAALAACAGADIRERMSAAQSAELAASVAATPFAFGNHWRATRGDDVVHLIGTLHLDDPRFQEPLERLTPMIQSAAILLLEANDRETAALQDRLARDPSLILLQDQSLIDLMPTAQWEKLSDAARSRGIPPFMAAKMQPWYLSMMLAIPPCMMADVQNGASGLDAQLNAIANDAGVPSQSLESSDTLFRIFGEEPIENQIEMMGVSLADPAAAEDGMTTTLATYFEEHVAEAWHINRIMAPELSDMTIVQANEVFADLDTELLANRNRAWIPVILKALDETDGTVVAAFGAAHLMGENGVANLLAHEGFTLERQTF